MKKDILLPYEKPAEAGTLSAGLDYYKPTMSQFAYEHEPDVEVTFTLKNRGEQRLLDHIDLTTLQSRLDAKRDAGWNQGEIDYLAGLGRSDGSPVFSRHYLSYLQTSDLPRVRLRQDPETDDLAAQVTGRHDLVTFWETVLMSDINEAYFEGYVRDHGLNLQDVYDEGKRRLDDKIAVLQSRPDITVSDFGTRRHFSYKWQRYVVERLAAECPGSLAGTSNVALARALSLKPIGTFAHEMPMTYAALADARGEDIRASHHRFLDDWYEMYGEDLSVVLTDTFGSDFFFADFTAAQAETWRGARHDSGDPVVFAEKLIAFYEAKGIDPKTKTIVFSDGLDIHEIVRLQDRFGTRLNTMFGWGTTLTNDLGIKPLNIVMKATHVRDTVAGLEADTVKLSDNDGKHTGAAELVDRYKRDIFAALTQLAVRSVA